MEDKRKKNKGLIVVIVIMFILVMICVVSGILFLTGFFNGPEKAFREVNRPNIENGAEDGNDAGGDSDGVVTEADMMSKQQPTETFAEVDVELEAFDINIKRGDKYEVDYACPKQMEPEIKVADNHLQIRGNGKHFTLNGNAHCEVTVMIPQDAKLGITKVVIDRGNIIMEQVISYSNDIQAYTGFVRMSGCECMATKVHCGIGDMTMESADLGVTDLSTYTGNIRVQASRFQDFRADVKTGNIEVQGMVTPQDQYRMNVAADDGNIQLNGQSQGKHYTSMDGNYSFDVRTEKGDVLIQ